MMRFRRWFWLFPMVTLILALPSCSGPGIPEKPATGEPAPALQVGAVNYPLAFFAERIGGDAVEVLFPVPAGLDPAFWNPDAGVVLLFQQADLILLNGASYAKWIDHVSLPRARLVNTSTGFSDRYIAVEDAVTHSHGPGGEHAHTGTAFTTWLDFGQAMEQARAIMAAMSRVRPEQAETFRENCAALEADLLKLDREIEALVDGWQDMPLVGSHPVYQYFSRRYGLNLECVTWEPGEVPNEDQWQELAFGLENHPAKWMIWEGTPAAESVARLAGMGVGSVVFDPCATVPESGDFLSVMRQNVENLKVVFQ